MVGRVYIRIKNAHKTQINIIVFLKGRTGGRQTRLCYLKLSILMRDLQKKKNILIFYKQNFMANN